VARARAASAPDPDDANPGALVVGGRLSDGAGNGGPAMISTEVDTAVVDAATTDSSESSTSTAERVAARLQALQQMEYAALRSEWRRLYRAHPPKRVARDLLMLGVAWKIQEQAYGGLGAATTRRLAYLAKTMQRDGDVTRNRVAHLKQGAKLVREWRGETQTVTVVADGFEWKGRLWRSLSMIAREITGVRWSGPRFFGLNGKAGRQIDTRAEETVDA